LYSIFQTAKQKIRKQKKKKTEQKKRKKKGTAQLGRTRGPNRPSQPGKETSPAPFPLSLSLTAQRVSHVSSFFPAITSPFTLWLLETAGVTPPLTPRA
jgi:hypothetical protein